MRTLKNMSCFVILSDTQRAILDSVKAEFTSGRHGRRALGHLPEHIRRDILALVGADIDVLSE